MFQYLRRLSELFFSSLKTLNPLCINLYSIVLSFFLSNPFVTELKYAMTNSSGDHGTIRSLSTGNLRMLAGSYYIPKRNELKPQGEDAHFISSQSQTFGIADGVGSWDKEGIDSGEYSRQLMNNACLLSIPKRGRPVDPVNVLNEAFLKTKAKGSSTACILTVKNDSLHAVNVGDSGFVLIRGEKIIYRSPVQHKSFNHPYQLGWFKKNDLKLAQKIKGFLAPGDVIVAGTDGLFDNVHGEEIETLVKNELPGNSKTPKILAWKIAFFALQKAEDRRARTPFAEERRKAGEKDAIGGKYDDITVVVAYILPTPVEETKLNKNKKKKKGLKKSGWGMRKILWGLGDHGRGTTKQPISSLQFFNRGINVCPTNALLSLLINGQN